MLENSLLGSSVFYGLGAEAACPLSNLGVGFAKFRNSYVSRRPQKSGKDKTFHVDFPSQVTSGLQLSKPKIYA